VVLCGVAAFVLLQAGAATSAPPAVKVTQFQVVGGGITDLVAGPGGIWFASLGPTHVGRMTVAGKVKRWKVPTLLHVDNSAAGNNIVRGPDGNIWITGETTSNRYVLAKVRPNGASTIVDLDMPNQPGRDAIAALGTRGGGPLHYGIWWNTLGRVATGGAILPRVTGLTQPTGAVGWAADRSGAMWFVYGRGYGRVTGTTAKTWEPGGRHNFVDVTLGVDGKMYLADRNAPQGLGIARVDATGTYKQYRVKGGIRAITTGPDRNVWGIGDFQAILVRLTPEGKLTQYSIPGNTGHIASGFGKLWIETGNAGYIGRVDLPAK
jgi:virginiamycin B lyase